LNGSISRALRPRFVVVKFAVTWLSNTVELRLAVAE
jgi:hypothetical protein